MKIIRPWLVTYVPTVHVVNHFWECLSTLGKNKRNEAKDSRLYAYIVQEVFSSWLAWPRRCTTIFRNVSDRVPDDYSVQQHSCENLRTLRNEDHNKISGKINPTNTSPILCLKTVTNPVRSKLWINIHSFSILSDDRSKASSKTMPPYSAMESLLLQMRISSPVLKVIQ